MNEKKELLTEENYERSKKKISKIALIVLIIGILIGGGLIATGLIKQGKVNDKYSDKNKVTTIERLESEKNRITEELDNEKEKLLTSKTQLEDKIKPVEDEIKSLERVTFTGFDDAYYQRQDKIEELKKSIVNDKKAISIIDEALDDSFDYCAFDAAKNNTYTSKYCNLKNQLKNNNLSVNSIDNNNSDFKKSFDSYDSIPFYMFGGFIIIASCMIAGSIYMVTKRREILSFQAQQVMPVGKEVIEKIAPTVGKAKASIAKEMAPAYGEIAKEISKGIKEGLKDEDKK